MRGSKTIWYVLIGLAVLWFLSKQQPQSSGNQGAGPQPTSLPVAPNLGLPGWLQGIAAQVRPS